MAYGFDPFAGVGWPRELTEEIERRAKSGELDPPESGVREPMKIQLGENPDSYLAVTFEDGVVLLRDSNDPSGRAVQVSYDQWRAWAGELRGDGDGDAADQPEKDTGGEQSPGQAHPGKDHIPPSKTIKTHSVETDKRVATPGKPKTGAEDRR